MKVKELILKISLKKEKENKQSLEIKKKELLISMMDIIVFKIIVNNINRRYKADD